jgi:hypothetical protein
LSGLPALVGHPPAEAAISVRASNATRSMLRCIARSPRGAQRAGRLDYAVSVTPAMPFDQFIDIHPA